MPRKPAPDRDPLVVRAVDPLSPLDLAQIELGQRVCTRLGRIYVDGRPSDARRMVQAANKKRAAACHPPIAYPGV